MLTLYFRNADRNSDLNIGDMNDFNMDHFNFDLGEGQPMDVDIQATGVERETTPLPKSTARRHKVRIRSMFIFLSH